MAQTGARVGSKEILRDIWARQIEKIDFFLILEFTTSENNEKSMMYRVLNLQNYGIFFVIA